MDDLDRKIVETLGSNGRITATDLADQLPLSVSATNDRLRRLLNSGLIRKFSIELDPVASGRPIEAFIDARLRRDVTKAEADGALAQLVSVVDAVHVTGRYDYQLSVAARDIADLDATLEQLAAVVGTEETNTRLVLRSLPGFPRPPAIA